jgi:hypothetical protein
MVHAVPYGSVDKVCTRAYLRVLKSGFFQYFVGNELNFFGEQGCALERSAIGGIYVSQLKEFNAGGPQKRQQIFRNAEVENLPISFVNEVKSQAKALPAGNFFQEKIALITHRRDGNTFFRN